MTNDDPKTVTRLQPAPFEASEGLPYVGTNQDGIIGNTHQRAVDIIDIYGDMVTLHDRHLPHVLTLLMRHLSGECIDLVNQDTPDDLLDSYELEEAREATARQIAAWQARYTAIVRRQQAIANPDSCVESMAIEALPGNILPWRGQAKQEGDHTQGFPMVKPEAATDTK